MKTLLSILFFAFSLITASSLAVGLAGEFGTSTSVWGNATIGTSAATGAVIDVFLGSGSTQNQTFAVGSQGPGVPSGYYQADVACDNITAVFVKVWGINGTAVGCKQGSKTEANITVSLVANDGSCKYGNACSSGICCSGTTQVNSSTSSGTCKSSCAAAAAADSGGGGSSGGGGGGGAATPKAPAAPSQETVDVVKGALPATFQVAADAGNVEYKTVSAPELKEVPVAVDAVTKTIEQLQTTAAVQSEEAKQAVAEVLQAISSSGGGATVAVKKTIEVVKATNKVTGESVTVSVVKLSVTAPADKALKNVEVIEVIPKAVANNINQVTFKGEKPVVLQADPVVKWAFAEVVKGQTKDLSYAVNKDISNLNTNTLAVSKKVEGAVQPPPAPEAPAPSAGEKPGEAKVPTPVNTIVLVVVLAVVVVAGWLFLKSRKKVKK